jgi:arylsulfatase A-like enzyme
MNDRPNIIFLINDDQRFDTVGAFNNPEVITPNLDRLVESGTVFSNVHVMGSHCDAVCMPSRAMIHSGRTLYHLSGNGEELPPDHTLLGEHLQQNGYTTFGCGKWHNDPASYGRSFGDGGPVFFGGMDDHWNMPVCNHHPDGKYPEPRLHNWDPGTGKSEMIPKRYDRIAHGVHATTLFADGVREYLLKRRRRREGGDGSAEMPFMAYCAFTAPHDPRTMPSEFRNRYPAGSITTPPNAMPEHPFDNGALDIRDEHLAALPRDPRVIDQHNREYFAMLTHMDAEVGRIQDALEPTGERDNTILVWTADHGLSVGRHGLMGKQNLYEHSVHVPLVIAGPGIQENEVRNQYIYLLDIYPTLCEILDLPIPASVEGMSFLPSIRNSRTIHRDHLHLCYGTTMRGVKRSDLKLIEYVVGSQRHTQLFDLTNDPHELRSRHDDPQYAAPLSELRRLLVAWRDVYDDPDVDFWERLAE